jgi:hypothetical protein
LELHFFVAKQNSLYNFSIFFIRIEYFIGLLQTGYMGVVLFGPATALEAGM